MDCSFVFAVVGLMVSMLARSNNAIRVWNATNAASTNFNVLDYGAIGDGKQDDTPAFSKAWEAACSATGGTPTLLVPEDKTFFLTPILFNGPCKSPALHFQIDGTLVAPDTIPGWGSGAKLCASGNAWLAFDHVDNLQLDGKGEIDGRGSCWWKKSSTFVRANDINDANSCGSPAALSLNACNGLQLRGLTHKDSPMAHIKLSGCDNAIVSNLNIMAPEDSPNTDGIDISSVTNLQILDSIIATGDDCIAIGQSSSFINISGITCGPGHGISVGSLGRGGAKAEVEEIHVRNCTFNKSTNGARIKTWQGGSGYARKITFEDIPFIDVQNPIVIDQMYCIASSDDNELSCPSLPSAVAVSDVTFSGFQGTTSGAWPITFNCSNSTPCTNIVMQDVSVTSSMPGKQLQSMCENVKGTETSVTPPVPCLN